jgi:hypothetical protein
MPLRARGWAVAVFALCACSASLDTSLEHKRCTSTGRCLAGYTCSDSGFCERSNDAQPGPAEPGFDADLDSGASERDAAASVAVTRPAAAGSTAAPALQSDAGASVPVSQPSAADPTAAPASPRDADAGPTPTQNPPAQMQAPPTQTQPPQTPPTTPPTQAPPVQNPPPQGSGAMGGACGGDQTRCGSSCVDLQHDDSNCGTCGHACTSHEGGGSRCEHGSCTFTCAGGLTACDDQCLDVASDSAHCGACNKVCKNEEICSAGRCTKPKAGEMPD